MKSLFLSLLAACVFTFSCVESRAEMKIEGGKDAGCFTYTSNGTEAKSLYNSLATAEDVHNKKDPRVIEYYSKNNYRRSTMPNFDFAVKEYTTPDQSFNARCTKTKYSSFSEVFGFNSYSYDCEGTVTLTSNEGEFQNTLGLIHHAVTGEIAKQLAANIHIPSGDLDGVRFSCLSDQVCTIELSSHFNEEMDSIPTK